MDDLPIELVIFIFKNYLNLTDLLTTRLVCKKWKMLSEDRSIKIKDLIINDVVDGFKTRWFYDDKLINYEYAIRYSTFVSLKSIYKFDINLKRLHFYCTDPSYLDFNQLNSLTQLEQLDLQITCDLDDRDKVRELSLQNLRILKLSYFNKNYSINDIGKCKIQLKTPNLAFLKCYELLWISIDGLNAIKYLEVDFHNEDKMMGLRDCLETYQCNAFPNLSEDFLSLFSNLKMLSCFIGPSWVASEVYFEDEIIDNIKLFVNQKNEAKSNVPKIFFQGVEIFEEQDLDYECQDAFSFQIINYNRLQDKLSPIDSCNYNELMNLTSSMPNDFFSKFLNIETVYTRSKIEGSNHFYWFLGKLDLLKSLVLNNTLLNQSFYDKLPDICQLTHLRVNENTLNLNYDFILKFKTLKSFETNQKFFNCSDLAIEAFNKLEYLEFFKFANQNGPISIGNLFYGLFGLNYYSSRLDDELDNLDGEFDEVYDELTIGQMVSKLPDIVRSS